MSHDDLLAIAKAARATPTSVNSQSRKFTIVQNKPLIQKLAAVLGQVIGQPSYDFYRPDALLLISSRNGYTYSQIETGLAVQNAYLAATALGLGTTWTDQIRNRCDDGSVRDVLTEMAIPKNHICWTVLPIGFPAENPPIKDRIEEINLIE